MAGPPRTLWRKASPRKATDESLLAACLPRHRPFAYPVCAAARKPRFRSGNPPRHVRSGTSVCVVARKPRFLSGNPSATHTNWHICLCRDKRRRFSVLDSGAAHQSLPDASPPGFGGDPLFPLIRKRLNYKRNDGLI